MAEQKILIITYYWPPSGGSGVQRWLKFVKYLPQAGWQPFVFTPENPSLVQKDESLLTDVPADAEVIHFPIWEPYKLASFATGSAAKENPAATQVLAGTRQSWMKRLSIWIRGNLFIPDPKIFWVRPSVAFLKDFLVSNNIRTIVTTGPPHSVHLIGLRLKKAIPSLNWIADFRDPWSEWPFLDSFHMTSLVKRIHRHLEQRVLQRANHITTVSPYYQRRFQELAGRRVTLLTNGFDEDDFAGIQYKRPDQFTIRHVGIVYEMANPVPFITALNQLCEEDSAMREQLRVEYVGEVNPAFQERVRGLDRYGVVSFHKQVPHRDLLPLYGSSSMLLLNIEGYQRAEGLLPGKLFEYLATGLPVLGIGPAHGDAAVILQEAAAGAMFEADQVNAIATFVRDHVVRWRTGTPLSSAEGVKRFSRSRLTAQLTELFK